MKCFFSLMPASCGSIRLVLRQTGLTLVELMISMALGMFIVLAATALLISTKTGYLAQDNLTRMQDTGRYALEIVSRSVRQAAYENWNPAEAPVMSLASTDANFSGLDARSLKSTKPGIESPVTKAINGSDVLAVRFFGAGAGEQGDGTMTNCAGFGVAAASKESMDESRGWSIFYVAEDTTGEPQLYCKFHGDSGWTAQSIASGVESFQVLYGLDTDADGIPNRFLNASAINALDASLAPADLEKMTHWKKVVAVKVAMLVRGSHSIESENLATEYQLFGKDYADVFGSSDPGVRIKQSALPKSERGKHRKVFSTTIYLHAQHAGSGA